MTGGPRYARVANDLRQAIASGEFRDGILASEADLCARHGVSRITVRRALEDLRREGLLESRKGAGWFVADAAADRPIAVFPRVLTDVPASVHPNGEIREFSYASADEAIAAALGLAHGEQILRVTRLHPGPTRPYEVVTIALPGEIGARITRQHIESRRLWAALRAIDLPVDRVTQRLSAVTPTAEDAELLQVTRRVPLLHIERVAWSSHRPVVVSQHRYPGDRACIEMEFHQDFVSAAETAGIRLIPYESRGVGEPNRDV